MIRDVIKIENNYFALTGRGNVWMTCEEIADLFGVLAASVQRAARKVADNDGVKSLPLGNGYSVDAYNLEMIISLAHKFDTAGARLFRKWIVAEVAYARRKTKPCIIVNFKTGITE